MKFNLLTSVSNLVVATLLTFGSVFLANNCLYFLDEPNIPEELR